MPNKKQTNKNLTPFTFIVAKITLQGKESLGIGSSQLGNVDSI